jgi:hypothetical protein
VRNQKTRKFEVLLAALAVAVAAALALPALGLAGKPVANDHYSFSSGPQPANWCGVVEGTSRYTEVGHFWQDSSGAFIENIRFTSVFTATASGKSIENSGAGVTKASALVPTADGGFTAVFTQKGLDLLTKLPNGQRLYPVGAGTITSVLMFDANGEWTGEEVVGTTGPHPFMEGVDFCGPTVAALT